MSFNDEYLKLRKKRLNGEETPTTKAESKAPRLLYQNKTLTAEEDDIAPFRGSTNDDNDTDKKWYEKIFKGSDAFDDGYQFGDVLKTFTATGRDLQSDARKGLLGLVETAIDTGAGIIGKVGGELGADEFKDNMAKFIAKEIINEDKIAKGLDFINGGFAIDPLLGTSYDEVEDQSVLGDTADGWVQSGGQLIGQVALAPYIPWYITSATSSYGSEMENALRQGATFDEAHLSATFAAASEIVSEKMFGGSGLGESGLINVDLFTKGISNKVVKMVADVSLDVFGEGMEEVFSGIGSAVGQKLSYASDKELNEIFSREDAFEAFVGGAILSGFANAGKVSNSAKTGRDYRTGLTENEQKVFDKVYEDAIAEATEGGKELTNKDKAEIYDEVMKSLQRGEVDTDTIESILGGEEYKAYKDTIEGEESLVKQKEALQEEINELNKMKLGEMTGEQRDRLEGLKDQYRKLAQQIATNERNGKSDQLKSQLSKNVQSQLVRQDGKKTQTDDYLIESYNEKARRQQAFEVDLSKYEGKTKEILENLMKKGQINNTRAAHEFWENAAKFVAKRGGNLTSATTEEILEMARKKYGNDYVEKNFKGKRPNAFVLDDGTVAINVKSPDSRRFLLGHEIMHTLEKTKHYGSKLKDLLLEFDKRKTSEADQKNRQDATGEMYEGIKGAEADKEYVADLAGKYIFNDADFVQHLANTDHTLFQTIFGEIKYFFEIATAGSQEKRDLLRIKREYERAEREYVKAQKAETETKTEQPTAEADEDIAPMADSNSDLDTLQAEVDRLQKEYCAVLKQFQHANRMQNTEAVHRLSERLTDLNQQLSRAEADLEFAKRKAQSDGETTKFHFSLDKYSQKQYNSFGWAREADAVTKNELDDMHSKLQEKRSFKKFPQSPNGEAIIEVNDKPHTTLGANNTFLFVTGTENDPEITRVVKVNMFDEDSIEVFRKGIYESSSNRTLETYARRIGEEFLRYYDRSDYADYREYANKSRTQRSGSKGKGNQRANRTWSWRDGTFTENQSDDIAPINETSSTDDVFFDAEKTKFSLSNTETEKTYLDAVKRGDMETAQKMVDEVAKEAGYDIKAFHGTRSKFTVFDKERSGKNYKGWSKYGKGFYFAETAENAEHWSAMAKGLGEMQTIPAYLRMENPFYLKPEEYESVEAVVEKMENLAEYVQANGYDGIVAPSQYVVFDSNQIKSADPITYDDNGNVIPLSERFNTENNDIRFSLSKSVEETKDLLVLHNITESKLLKQLELDGFPMPSLAVTNQPHTNFGSISILFDKDTIDPKKNKRNKTYSADAWTPTFPRIEYEADRDISHAFVETLRGLIDDSYYNGSVSSFLYDVEDSLNRNGGYDGYIDNLAEKPAIQYAFLKSKGENIEIAQKAKEIDLGFHTEDRMIDRYKAIINDFSGDVSVAKKMTLTELAENSSTLKQLLDRYAFNGKMQQLSFIGRVLDQTIAYQNYDPNAEVEAEYIPDYAQTEKDIQARIDTNELKAWLKEQTKGIVANSGVYNGKEIFTPSGNRRSFQQLHYPVTVENIVKSMASQGEKSVTSFHGVKTLRATTAKTFKSIAEIQKAKGKLQNLSEAEVNQIHDELSNQMYEVFNKIIGENPKMFRKDDIFALDTMGEVLSEVEYENINASYIKGVFNKYGYNMSSETADDCFKLLDAISSMPVYIFEAKPQRVVGYDEIKAVVIPENTSNELKNALTKRGINFVEYDGTEADRQAKLKDVATANDSYFSLSREGAKPIRLRGDGAMSDTYLAPLREDIAPVQEDISKTETTIPTVSKMEQVADYAPITEEEANALQSERIASLDDTDAPPETEAPYYGENEDLAPIDPFDDRDIKAVGNRSVKAYMYENPEVKPFFQAEANRLLGELRDTTKGERFFTPVEGGVPGAYGAESYGVWTGTSRHTTQDMEYLLDTLKMSYADIEKGLNAIIEDNGAENIAAAKRIEFVLNDRLMKGYQDISGYDIPPDQDYINLLKEKNIIEYNEEAQKRLFENADEYVPTDDIAPVAVAEEITETPKIEKEPIKTDDVAPTFDTAKKGQINGQQTMFEEAANSTKKEKKIETIKDRLEHKLHASYGELSHNKRLRREALEGFNNKIDALQLEYDSKKNKDTKVANNILRRIERLKRMRDDVEADYTKRINDNRAKVEKYKAKLEEGYDDAEGRVMRKELHQRIVDGIKSKFAEKGSDLDEALKKAKDLSTFATVDNTPQRVMEKSLGYKEGQILADETVNKVAQNETEGIKWLNSYLDRKNGELAKISKQYHIKPGSKESGAAQIYAEGFYVNDNGDVIEYGDAELAKDFPDAQTQANIKGLAGDQRIRQIYDETLKAINESRARNAYPEIPRLDNYFLHFRAMEDTFSRLGLPFNPNDIRAKDLPTDLNGVTADLKPGQPYFASQFHRRGNKTTYDLLGGLERYLTSAKNQIYHIDDIQTLRALRNYIADTYGQAKGLESLDNLTEEEVQERIKQVYGSHLSTFAKFLNEEANIIAGKTSLMDRGLEGIIGRRGITFLDTVNKQVGSNMVGFNVSSSLTNFIPVVQAFAKTNKTAFVKGFTQTVAGRLGLLSTDNFAETSPVMIRRKGADRFDRTPFQKVADAGYTLMSAVDSISTEIIARAKYNELTAKGMASDQAHIETDKWVSRLMGDRSLGQMPQLYNSKMLGLVTKFQLEVRNQLDSQFYDTIQEAKASNEDIKNQQERNAKTAAKVASTFFQLAVAQHVFGKVFESIAGYNPTFDIIGALIKAFGLDDDEESEDTVLDNIEQGFLALLEDMPYASVVMDGGRIPISSALPIGELITGKDEYGNEKSRLETLGEIAPYYVLPGGYGQLKKTVQGLSMFSDDHPIAGSYTDSGKLRFAVDDTLGNRIQAGIFGQYANKNARQYFDEDRSPLTEKQTRQLANSGLSMDEYWDYQDGLRGLGTLAEKADYISELDLPMRTKNDFINYFTDRKEDIDLTNYDDYGSFEEFDYAEYDNPEMYSFLQENGVSYEEYDGFDKDTKRAWTWAFKNPEKYTVSKAVSDDFLAYYGYRKALNDLEADKDEDGNSISGSKKEKVIDYINDNLDNLDYGQKIILYRSMYNSREDRENYNNDIVDYLNGRNDISYEEMEMILKELGFEVDAEGNIYW